MLDLLDAMSELVYVVDIDTYELLYMNASGKQQFGLDSLDGLKCYRVIQGRNIPCPFCTTPYLCEDSYYTWEKTNMVTGRHYLLKDKLFPWEGHNARIEIAFDTTEQRETLEAETLLVDCVKELQMGGPLCKTAGPVLRAIGQFARATRALALEMDHSRILKAHEWCAQGFPLISDSLRGLDLGAPRWEHAFGHQFRVVLSPHSDADSLCIAVVDPPPDRVSRLPVLLQTLASLMGSVLQKERDQETLKRLSYTDSLTGALNRNAFTRDSEQLQSTPCSAGVVHLSVNGLKGINDRSGRQYGDQVLVNTVHTLHSILGQARVYRMGGDEFVAVWQDAAPENFEAGVQKIKEWQERELNAKFSLGYAWAGNCTDLHALAAEAEERMYLDKRGFYRGVALPKRYRPSFDQSLCFTDVGTLNQMLLDQRFSAFYQPKFSVSSREIIGAEALVRCLTDSGQLLPPGRFIPLLEEARLIGRVDFFMFEQVCAKIAGWIAKGKNIAPVSVNFSRYSIQEPWFHDTLLQIWDKYRIPKQYVEIEITESAQENGGKELLGVLARLRADGFSVSIDDFGVKYANLSVLTNSDFSTLKIDKSLMDDWENPRTREILRMLCEICRRTGVQLIAEGVESEGQFAFLQDIRCEGVQGYLFSQPLPLREYERRYLTPQNEESAKADRELLIANRYL